MVSAIILLQLACLYCATAVEWDGFRVKHAWSGALADTDSFFDIPRSARDASAKGFVDTPNQMERGLDLTMKCLQDDVRVCPLYDRGGTIAGLQIAIPEKDLEGTAFNIGSKMKLKSILGQAYWTSTHYVIPLETIRNGGRKGTIKDTIEGIWIENGNELMNIPVNEDELAQNTLFKKQNCIPNMGTHYYYNVTPEMDCHQFQPYFVLVKNKKALGIGFQVFGQTPEVGRPWFEYPPSRAVEMTLPSAPPCLEDWSKIYHVVSLHIYYINEPWDIKCEDGDSLQPMSVVNKLLLNTSRYTGKIIDGAKKVFQGLTN